MAYQLYYVEDIGDVKVIKKRGNRSLRLSFDQHGGLRLSLPYLVSTRVGLAFVKEKQSWIEAHRPAPRALLHDKAKIGKAHHLNLLPDPKVKSVQVRLKDGQVIVKYPTSELRAGRAVQAAAERGAKKALKLEAEKLLPQKLELLAEQHGFKYRSVDVKQLKSKWGSCSHQKQITLNYYLMQLPWNLIDYVLIHELVHTEHLNHSLDFWLRFESILPGAKKLKKQLKPFKTAVTAID